MFDIFRAKKHLKSIPVNKIRYCFDENCEKLSLEMLLTTSQKEIYIEDLSLTLTIVRDRNFQKGNQMKLATKTNSVRNNIKSNLTTKLITDFEFPRELSQVKNIIADYKIQIYHLAKNYENFIERRALSEQIRCELQNIKQIYIDSLMSAIFFSVGGYVLEGELNYRLIPSLKLNQNRFKLAFEVSNDFQSIRIDIDNFLAQIMSNIFFSPVEKFVLKPPEYKPIILQVVVE